MRKGSRKIAKAFLNQERAKLKNTCTDGTAIYLHGHMIMWWQERVIHFSLCGWNTVTTRDRINTVLEMLGKRFRLCQHKFDPYVCLIDTRQLEEISSRLSYSVDDFG